MTSKVLAILIAFERYQRPLALTEIADIVGIPVSTTHRLVAELTEWEFLMRAPNGKYSLGLRVWEMAQTVGRQLRGAAAPFIQEMFLLTGESSHLVIRDGADSLYIERIHDTRYTPRTTAVGGRQPLHTTSGGKVLLAFETEEFRNSYLESPLIRKTSRTITNPQMLATELEDIRAKGFGLATHELRGDVGSIAVPTFHRGRVGAAIGIVVPTERLGNIKRHLPVLLGISSRIEKATSHIPLESLLRVNVAYWDNPEG